MSQRSHIDEHCRGVGSRGALRNDNVTLWALYYHDVQVYYEYYVYSYWSCTSAHRGNFGILTNPNDIKKDVGDGRGRKAAKQTNSKQKVRIEERDEKTRERRKKDDVDSEPGGKTKYPDDWWRNQLPSQLLFHHIWETKGNVVFLHRPSTLFSLSQRWLKTKQSPPPDTQWHAGSQEPTTRAQHGS